MYDSEGLIIYFFINGPGSQHDSQLSLRLYHILRTKIPDGFGLAADTAFSTAGTLAGKVFKPLKTDEIKKLADNPSVRVCDLIRFLKKHRAAVSVRQVAHMCAKCIQCVLCVCLAMWWVSLVMGCVHAHFFACMHLHVMYVLFSSSRIPLWL